MQRSLEQWLRWQETLHPSWMDLKLERVSAVAQRLGIHRPPGPVFTVAGTNGKGSTVALLAAFLSHGGRRAGVYTSPHLVRYNERISVAGEPATNVAIVAAFEAIEAARGNTSLTFFEYGTLAALLVFAAQDCDSWVLEVGLGGRLDAVNIIDPDFSLITTIALDHEEYLGTTVEAIAREKAGILRPGRPGFFGDQPVPQALRRHAADIGAPLRCLGEDFSWRGDVGRWSFRGEALQLDGLARPAGATAAQLNNMVLVLAALEQFDRTLVADAAVVDAVAATARPPGRFQRVVREHEWILDVAHNPQAAATLAAQLGTLQPAPLTCVIGMLGDKALDGFVAPLAGEVHTWLACTVEDPRARGGEAIATRLRELGQGRVETCAGPAAAFARAAALTPPGGRILVCGSFRVVGPALQWLGIY